MISREKSYNSVEIGHNLRLFDKVTSAEGIIEN